MDTFGGRIRSSSTQKQAVSGLCTNMRMLISGGEQHEYETTPILTTGYTQESTTSMEDIVTPNFHKLRANGAIINSPMIRYVADTIHAVPTVFEGTVGNYYSPPYNHILNGNRFSGMRAPKASSDLGEFLPQIDFESEKVRLTNLAVTDSYANLSQTGPQSLMMLAEYDKSISSIVSVLRKGSKVMRAIWKADLKYLRGQLSKRNLQESWMEARYGIRPICYDARDISEAIMNKSSSPNSRITSRGYANGSDSVGDTIELITSDYLRLTIKRTSTYSIDIRAGVLSDVRRETFAKWGGDQLAETVWEIVPFSFIADWFANIGATIAAHTPDYGVQRLASWVTRETKWVTQNQIVGVEHKNSYDVNNISWSGVKAQSITRIEREPNFPLAAYPVFRLRMNGAKLLDLAIIFDNFAKVKRFK